MQVNTIGNEGVGGGCFLFSTRILRVWLAPKRAASLSQEVSVLFVLCLTVVPVSVHVRLLRTAR